MCKVPDCQELPPTPCAHCGRGDVVTKIMKQIINFATCTGLEPVIASARLPDRRCAQATACIGLPWRSWAKVRVRTGSGPRYTGAQDDHVFEGAFRLFESETSPVGGAEVRPP